jgi:ribokinase
MKVLTVGGAMIDTIAIIEPHRIERMTMANADESYLLLAEGRKTEALEVSTHCGGGAINAAVCVARLGADTAALAKLGQDDRAETVMARLMAEGVSARWVLRDRRATTGASVMVSSHDRNAAIFTYRGANTLLEAGDLKDDAFAVDLVYVSSLSNRSADCFPEIIARAKAHKAFVATNPGIRQISSRGSALSQCLAQIDLFALNRAEADVLVPSLVAEIGEGGPVLTPNDALPLPELALRGLAGGGYEISLPAYFAAMARKGVRYAVVTDGKGGCYLGTSGTLYHCPILQGDVAGTAGAGDSYLATLAAMLVDGVDVAWAMRFAAANSSSVVAHVDTQTGLLSRQVLDDMRPRLERDLPVQSWPISTASDV